MYSETYLAKTLIDGKAVIISFYKENPGGWKLDFTDEAGSTIPNGDLWVQNLDDLILQIANRVNDDLEWRAENSDNSISFYEAIKQCIVELGSRDFLGY